MLEHAYSSPRPKNEFEGKFRALPRVGWAGRSDAEYHREDVSENSSAVSGAVNILESLLERLELVDEAQPPVAADPTDPSTRKVFVVHGHDEGRRDQVARVLEALRLTPVILSEKAWQGRTIAEQLDIHGDVAFAVVILDPDDYGRGPEDDGWPSSPNRARQNVILELGYFIGRLGRDRVVALNVDGTELPSDYHGVGYIKFDGSWAYELGRELKACFEVDLNDLL
jgi:predicted nucleotide-binding protein